jgi:hypothetical protein
VKLSDTEKLQRTTELLAAMSAKDALVAKKSLQTAEINAEIKTAQKVVRELSDNLKDGSEERDVECVEVHDFSRNTVTLRRLDTNEVVEERAMSLDERQETLPLDVPSKTTPKPGPGAPIATVGEIAAASAGKRKAPLDIATSNEDRCPAMLQGERCIRKVHAKGAHAIASLDGKSNPDVQDWAADADPAPKAKRGAKKRK